MNRDTYREKLRMLAAISRAAAVHIRLAASNDEKDRLMSFVTELFREVEFEPAAPLPTELPESAFAVRSDGLSVCGQRDFLGSCTRIKGHDGNCQDFLRDMPCQPTTKGVRS